MFVILKHGGKQYWARKGDVLSLEKINGEVGDKINLDIICSGDNKKIELEKKQATAEITKHFKDDKVIIFKKTKRHRYEKKQGHRQLVTNVKIISFS